MLIGQRIAASDASGRADRTQLAGLTLLTVRRLQDVAGVQRGLGRVARLVLSLQEHLVVHLRGTQRASRPFDWSLRALMQASSDMLAVQTDFLMMMIMTIVFLPA